MTQGRASINPVPAQPPRYGLLVAAPVTPTPPGLPSGQRWQAGVSWNPEQCGVSGRAAIECAGGTIELHPGANAARVDADPFLVWASDQCSPFGFAARDWSGRATRQLEATQSFQIAQELWTGTLSTAEGLDNRALTDSASDTVTNGPASILDGFACLEQALGQCAQGRRGMIHVTPQVLAHLVTNNTVRVEGAQYLSPLGNIVVADAGYDGSGPGGVAASTSQWAYATGIIAVTLESSATLVPGDIAQAQAMAQALRRTDNTLTVFAQKLAMYQWDECCHIAAELDLPVCLVGGAS